MMNLKIEFVDGKTEVIKGVVDVKDFPSMLAVVTEYAEYLIPYSQLRQVSVFVGGQRDALDEMIERALNERSYQ